MTDSGVMRVGGASGLYFVARYRPDTKRYTIRGTLSIFVLGSRDVPSGAIAKGGCMAIGGLFD